MTIFIILAIAFILVIIINKDKKPAQPDLAQIQKQDAAMNLIIKSSLENGNTGVNKSGKSEMSNQRTTAGISFSLEPAVIPGIVQRMSDSIIRNSDESTASIDLSNNDQNVLHVGQHPMENIPKEKSVSDIDNTDGSFKDNTFEHQERSKQEKYKATGSVFSNLFRLDSESRSTAAEADDNIIDVNASYTSVSLPKQDGFVSDAKAVVTWPHSYIYSYDTINSASAAQQAFYKKFKASFLKAEYLNLYNNNNYAFILLFDLYREFSSQKNLPQTLSCLKALAEHYPVTQRYTIQLFLKKLQEENDWETYNNVVAQNNVVTGSGYENYWRIGDRYRTKLKLNSDEVVVLNKLRYSGNAFCNTESCFMQVLKIYLLLIKKLQSIGEGYSLDSTINIIGDQIVRKHYGYRPKDYSYPYTLEAVTGDLYTNILKRCENIVREIYGHKRKLTLEVYPSAISSAQFEIQIVQPVAMILEELKNMVELPDEKTEVELNSQNTTRWKQKFETICISYKKGQEQEFQAAIIKLGQLNINNPSIENIFYEASKFIAKADKERALWLYIHYLYYDLRSVTFDNKQLTKTIQKNLFSNQEQLQNFESIISKLIADKDLDAALADVPQVYAMKRKKIQLDRSAITAAEQLHSGTVELLNEYLKDEFDDEHAHISSHQETITEIIMDIQPKGRTVSSGIYKTELLFNDVQLGLLELLQKNNFTIEKESLEIFTKEHKVFPGQLIESVNEICYDFIDDLLIEEEEDYYSIQPDYYKTICAI